MDVIDRIDAITNGHARKHADAGKYTIMRGEEALHYLFTSAIGAHSKVAFDAGLFQQFTDAIATAKGAGLANDFFEGV